MGKEKKKDSVWSVPDSVTRSVTDRMSWQISEAVTRQIAAASGIQRMFDQITAQYRAVLGPRFNTGTASQTWGLAGQPDQVPRVANAWARGVLGEDPFGLQKRDAQAVDAIRRTIAQAVGLDRIGRGLGPSAGFADSGLLSYRPNPFAHLVRPISPQLPGLAEKLAEQLFPPNLQGFNETEWAQLIDMVTDDGIGLMWAPTKRHLNALLKEPDRASRYAYLLAERDAVLDEVEDGLGKIRRKELQDLADLGTRAVETARAGLWEAALSLATDVAYSAMETKALDWYHEEFKDLRDERGNPIRAAGPGGTVKIVIGNVPMPPRKVGIFELRAHLVVRPLSSTFANSATVQGMHNRHAICHTASYDSIREEYLMPALLNMHSLLRGLEAQMNEAEMDEAEDD